MQSIFGSGNCINGHANHTSRSHNGSRKIICKDNKPIPVATRLQRETRNIRVIAIIFCKGTPIPSPASAADTSSETSMAAALIAMAVAIFIGITSANQQRKLKRQLSPQHHRRDCITRRAEMKVKNESVYREEQRPINNVSGQSKSNHSRTTSNYLLTILYVSKVLTYSTSCQRSIPWHEVLDFPLFHVHRIFLSTIHGTNSYSDFSFYQVYVGL